MIADIHTFTGAYVLDALSEAERAAFEQHMTQCAACGQEVAELRETSARLGAAATAEVPTAPAGLKRRVLAEIAQLRQLPPVGQPAPVVVLRPRRWPLWVAGVAAAASILVAVVLGVGAAQTNQRLTDELAAVQELLAAPDAELTRAQATGGAGAAVVSRSRGEVLFVAESLPALPAGRTYQLWLTGDGDPRSAGVLEPVDRPKLAANAAGAEGLAVTVEPAGGSSRPTTDPVLELAWN